LPCYGLAEATLAVTFARLDASLHADRLDGAAMKNGDAVPTNKADAVEVVSCGKAFRNHEIRIVDDSGEPVPDRRVGRVMLRGPSVTGGYFCNLAETAETFVDGWLKTGDLGYLAEGNLFVCGREKDLIIINGKNFYPQDIERIASHVRELRADQCVAFSRLDEDGKERCVLVAELLKRGTDRARLRREIVLKMRSELGITIDEVVFIKRNTLPKTSSGKVRRRETKLRLERGSLELSQCDSQPPVAHVPNPRPSRPATL
ncbi:MAG: AMP-binding protein, partial [Polyangiaceae bacterium]